MNVKHLIISKSLLLKACSLILGYMIWYTLSSHTICTHTFTVPIYYYNQDNQELHINAPENINLTFKAARSFMRLIDYSSLAVHIDAQKLHKGENYVSISHKDLLLPQEIAVTHYTPLRIVATLT